MATFERTIGFWTYNDVKWSQDEDDPLDFGKRSGSSWLGWQLSSGGATNSLLIVEGHMPPFWTRLHEEFMQLKIRVWYSNDNTADGDVVFRYSMMRLGDNQQDLDLDGVPNALVDRVRTSVGGAGVLQMAEFGIATDSGDLNSIGSNEWFQAEIRREGTDVDDDQTGASWFYAMAAYLGVA